MTGAPLVVVGDVLLDRDVEGDVERVCPDAPAPVLDERRHAVRAGGAGLAAALAATDGRDVTLVTALAGAAGREAAVRLDGAGVRVCDLGRDGDTPEKIRLRAGGRTLLRLDRGAAAGAPGGLTAAASEAIAGADAVLVSDYGGGITKSAPVRDVLAHVARRRPLVWDPHPRGSVPVPGVRLVTPNRAEAARFADGVAGDGAAGVAAQAGALVAAWDAHAVAVTLGADGAVLVGRRGEPVVVPAERATSGDACGAGDRFAAAAAGLLADGALPADAVAGAVGAASAFVAAGGAGAMGADAPAAASAPAPGRPAEEAIAATRARGGTVVATGGCFDLVHAGHVATLRAARSLGDCLVVCLNSDASVRRLKGPDRPLVPQDDRAAVLEALGCVDAVCVFDEDTPEAILDRLRPDVFAKGGDYAGAELPEAAVLARWGGRAVILPYLEGRSTSRMIEEALRVRV